MCRSQHDWIPSRAPARGYTTGYSPLSTSERIGELGHQSDEISLPGGCGFPEQAVEVGFDGRLTYAERIGCVGHAAHLNDAEQHAQLGRREVEGLGNDLGRRRPPKRGLPHEQSGYRPGGSGCATTRK